MIRFILGQARTGKTAGIFREIAARTEAGQGGVVLLVPEQYSHEAERELCQAVGDSLSLYGEVLSFTGLARQVFSQCGGARPVMDGGGRLLCMALAVESLAGRLRIYGKSRRNPQLLESLLRAVEELENSGANGDQLIQAAADIPDALGDKLREMALIMEAYRAVQGQSAADPADVLEMLAACIGQSPAAGYHYYVDGFSDFTGLEKKVLRALIAVGADMTVCLTCAREEQPEFSLVRDTVRWFRKTAEEFGVSCREEWMERGEDSHSMAYFCSHLFDFAPPLPPENRDGSVRLITAVDPYEECELAAAYMMELTQKGARWRDMAVAVRGFEDYRIPLESACARYGVPLFLSGRRDMMCRSVPMVTASVLEAVNHGYEYDAMFAWLKTGLGPISLEECDQLENYVLLWNIQGHLWTRPFTMHPEGYNRPFDEAAKDQLEKLNVLRQHIMEPLERLKAALRREKTAKGQARALGDFLVDVRLPERLDCRAAELEGGGRQEAAAETGQLWNIVCTALEQFAAVLGDMPMDGEQFQGLFCLMLSQYDVGVIPVSLDRVQAGDMDGMRRRHIKYLLVLGATDGRLPAPPTSGGLFTTEEREALSAMGIPMGGMEEDFARELGKISGCLALPSQSLYISWPTVDGDGEKTQPSMIAERAQVLLGIEPEEGEVLRARTFALEPAYTLAVQGTAAEGPSLCLAAKDYFESHGRGGQLSALVRGAGADRGSLSPKAVRALYGASPVLSATQAEKFADCRFSYFMQYGLKAKPRRPAVFDPRDYGTFMHYVLERIAAAAMDLGGFSMVTSEQIGQLTDQYVDQYIQDEMEGLAGKSARFVYLFQRLRGTVHRVTEDMWQELRRSRFQPVDLELDLGAEGVLEPEKDSNSQLTGRADRVDGWIKDGVLYLRITDYKTGVKKFSLSDICEGINMQMLLYLFTLQKRGKEHFQAEEIQPAGVLYSPARFEIIQTDCEVTDEELAALRRGKARRSGLLLAEEDVLEAMEPGDKKEFIPVSTTKDGTFTKASLSNLASLEQFGSLSRYIYHTLQKLANELRAGSVKADPWFQTAQNNACAWCDFQEACLFDEERDCMRIRRSLSTEEAWKKIEQTAGEVHYE